MIGLTAIMLPIKLWTPPFKLGSPLYLQLPDIPAPSSGMCVSVASSPQKFSYQPLPSSSNSPLIAPTSTVAKHIPTFGTPLNIPASPSTGLSKSGS